MLFRIAENKDLVQIRTLWRESFKDDTFEAWYFENLFSLNSVIVCELDGYVVAMLQRIVLTMNNDILVSYIYGACTRKNYRNKGIMTQLLCESQKLDIEMNMDASFLIPENKALFDYYYDRNYNSIIYNNTIYKEYVRDNYMLPLEYKVNIVEGGRITNSCLEMLKLYSKHYMNRVYVNRDEDYMDKQIDLFNANNGRVFELRYKLSIAAYCFLYEENIIIIKELIYSDARHKGILLDYLSNYYKKDLKVTEYNSDLTSEYGCLKKYNNQINEDDYVFSLMFD